MTTEGTHLGKQSTYPQHYAPSVLVAVPRELNREQYNIKRRKLPFTGIDVWHAYEFSFLIDNGLPVVGVLKIIYPCTSKFLIESKSLKLYLNSFNMDKFGTTREEGIKKTCSIISKDLKDCLGGKVELAFIDHKQGKTNPNFEDYIILEEKQVVCRENFTVYTETPELLQESRNRNEIKWGSHLLRSNCKITNQPDWGSVYVYMKGDRLPKPQSFIQYIVSLRNENHFHEEICEMIFKRLTDIFEPKELMVCCLYTRRGGIDINPIRSSHNSLIPDNLLNVKVFESPAFRQ